MLNGDLCCPWRLSAQFSWLYGHSLQQIGCGAPVPQLPREHQTHTQTQGVQHGSLPRKAGSVLLTLHDYEWRMNLIRPGLSVHETSCSSAYDSVDNGLKANGVCLSAVMASRKWCPMTSTSLYHGMKLFIVKHTYCSHTHGDQYHHSSGQTLNVNLSRLQAQNIVLILDSLMKELSILK